MDFVSQITLIKQFRAKNDGDEKTDSMFTGIPTRAESFYRNKYGEENLK